MPIEPDRHIGPRYVDEAQRATRPRPPNGGGHLGQDAVAATLLEPSGLSKTEAGSIGTFVFGSVVPFRQRNRDARISRGRAYRVNAIDAEAGTVSLVSPQGREVAWSLALWCGDQAGADTEVAAEFHNGYRLRFTRSNRPATRASGDTARLS